MKGSTQAPLVLFLSGQDERLQQLARYQEKEGAFTIRNVAPKKGVDELLSQLPAALIVDMHTTGLKTARAINEQQPGRQFPILFLGISPVPNELSIAFSQGDEYIAPTCTADEFVARLSHQMARYKQWLSMENLITARTQQLEKEKKRTEDNELRLRLAIEGSQDGLWDWNLKTNQAFYSARFTEMLGYTTDKIQPKGDSWIDLLHPDDKENTLQVTEDYLNKQIPHFQHVFRMVTQSGSFRWILARGKAIWDSHGSPLRFIGFIRDITEQKMAEVRLRESENKFRKLSETTSMGILIYQNDYWVYVNPGAENITGYSTKELMAMPYYELVAPEFREFVKTQGSNRQKGYHAVNQYELQIITKQGQRKWLYLEGNTTEYNGAPAGLLAVLDITQRKKTEQALAANETKLRNIIEHSSNVFYSYRPDYMLTYISPQAKQLLGYQPKANQFLWTDLLTDNLANATCFELIEKALKTGNKQRPYEIELRRHNGEARWAEVHEAPLVENGQVVAMVGALIDINERKLMNKELQKSKTRFQMLFEQAADGILIGNKNGIITDANKSICHMSGYSREELIGQNIKILFPDEVIKEKPLRYDLLQQGEAVKSERTLMTNNGGLVFIEMHTRKVSDGRLQAYMRDITDRKKTEQLLKEQNEQLITTEEELKASNEELSEINELLMHQKTELKKAKEQAEESDRLKSAFLANMSHEIRTPMNGILGFTHVLRRNNLSDEKRLAYLQIIEQSSHRMLNLINDLIDISKIESGQMDLNNELINITGLVKGLYDFFQLEAQNKGLEMHLHLPEQTIEAVTDKNRLSQVLSNLIKNAIKYTPQGQITIGLEVNKTALTFYVKDTGKGIPSEHLDKVFERFQQGHQAQEGKEGGAGLGLAISKAFIELMGGAIWVESARHRGSTFFVSLPYVQRKK